MPATTDQIEKHTLVARLSLSLYKMDESQLQSILNLLENKPDGIIGGPESNDANALTDKDPNIRRQMMIARIFILIKQLDKDALLLRLRPFQHPEFRWVREFPRLSCYLQVDFAAGGKAYRSCIRDISASGVFIETGDAFKVGQDIALCFTLSESNEMLPFKLQGRVTQIYPDGIGVRYLNMSQYQREIIQTLIDKIQ
jgi:Tfp pilus assembly protein PilZ